MEWIGEGRLAWEALRDRRAAWLGEDVLVEGVVQTNMFTGIVETLGEVAEVKPTPSGFRLRVGDDAVDGGEARGLRGRQRRLS